MKRFTFLLLCALSTAAFAEEAAIPTSDINDKCMLSVRNVYKFYYHNVHPNPNPSCHTNKLMDKDQNKNMEDVIAELRKDCPAYVIAQVNQTLVADKGTG